MSYYFISYDVQDSYFTEHILLPKLRQCGFNHWKTRMDALTDASMTKGVASAVNRSWGVVLIVSQMAMACEDIKYEWGYANYIQKPIIPVMIEAPEVIHFDGTLQQVYPVHAKLARERWYNFSDESHYEWDSLTCALLSIACIVEKPERNFHTTIELDPSF